MVGNAGRVARRSTRSARNRHRSYHHPTRVESFLDFALIAQARHERTAESGSFSHGPTVRLKLLSTPPRGDAVTLGIEAVARLGTDFHRADVAPSRAHGMRLRLLPPYVQSKYTHAVHSL